MTVDPAVVLLLSLIFLVAVADGAECNTIIASFEIADAGSSCFDNIYKGCECQPEDGTLEITAIEGGCGCTILIGDDVNFIEDSHCMSEQVNPCNSAGLSVIEVGSEAFGGETPATDGSSSWPTETPLTLPSPDTPCTDVPGVGEITLDSCEEACYKFDLFYGHEALFSISGINDSSCSCASESGDEMIQLCFTPATDDPVLVTDRCTTKDVGGVFTAPGTSCDVAPLLEVSEIELVTGCDCEPTADNEEEGVVYITASARGGGCILEGNEFVGTIYIQADSSEIQTPNPCEEGATEPPPTQDSEKQEIMQSNEESPSKARRRLKTDESLATGIFCLYIVWRVA
ncbi:hypothetical protein THAOC_34164 [Thalassiosira oceanica]|uniref:Uncharacterized protein n=1 Tax=Thalassiosira oceanica TaxID=159749 RepID=K0RDL0_THAOC|nr:hypothetical protein THAOC_34164 [Thalassiosira oceanica]|eukprot:EJK47141.1 hypothetical protein THAOC_34164 [Thalassiosira oceanica]